MALQRKTFIYVVITGITAGIYLFVFPSFRQYFPSCIFHSLTGYYCPGCGSQRSISALLNGHPYEAIHNNLLFVCIGLPLFIYYLVCTVRGRTASFLYRPWLPYTLFALVLTFTILRNLPFNDFAFLKPL